MVTTWVGVGVQWGCDGELSHSYDLILLDHIGPAKVIPVIQTRLYGDSSR